MNAKAKKIIKRTLKVLLWTVVTLVVLVALVLWAVVWAISPENLTKYAEQAANEYLDAKVEIGRLELTAYSTFPMLHVGERLVGYRPRCEHSGGSSLDNKLRYFAA